MGARKIEEPNRVLVEANTPYVPPGMTAAPLLENDDYYRQLPTKIQTYLRVLEKSGRAVRASEVSGFPSASAYRLRGKDSEFARLWTECLSNRHEVMEDEAIRRAVHGVDEPVYYMGAVCGYKRNYSDSLLGKLLEGNMPERYRPSHKIELDAKVAIATLVLPAATTAEEWMEQNNGTIIDQLPEDDTV